LKKLTICTGGSKKKSTTAKSKKRSSLTRAAFSGIKITVLARFIIAFQALTVVCFAITTVALQQQYKIG
jgi:hypothetical protein